MALSCIGGGREMGVGVYEADTLGVGYREMGFGVKIAGSLKWTR